MDHFQALKWSKKWLKRDKKVTIIEQIISRLQGYIHIKKSKKNTTFYHKITRKISQISRQDLSYCASSTRELLQRYTERNWLLRRQSLRRLTPIPCARRGALASPKLSKKLLCSYLLFSRPPQPKGRARRSMRVKSAAHQPL